VDRERPLGRTAWPARLLGAVDVECARQRDARVVVARVVVGHRGPRDEVSDERELAAVVLEDLGRGREVLRIGEHQLAREAAQIVVEALAQPLGTVVVAVRQHAGMVGDGAADLLPVELDVGILVSPERARAGPLPVRRPPLALPLGHLPPAAGVHPRFTLQAYARLFPTSLRRAARGQLADRAPIRQHDLTPSDATGAT
jgi:hypothetical protein